MALTLLSKLLLAALASVATAQSCNGGGPQYNSVSNYGGPNQCVPTGYTQSKDYGQTTQSQLQTQCGNYCQSQSNCGGFVAQLHNAADSSLQTGECYFYTQIPASPASCANAPSVIFAQAKDNTYGCFTSSSSSATAYCSSYLSIGKKTSYTATTTPTVTVTSMTTTSFSITLTTSTTSISTTTLTSSITQISITTASNIATVTSYSFAAGVVARAVTLKQKAAAASASPPACLNTQSIPASRVSSACSCLSITSTTIRTISTAPASTTVLIVTVSTTSTFSATTTLQTTTTPVTTTLTTTSTTATAVSTAVVDGGTTSYFNLVDPSTGNYLLSGGSGSSYALYPYWTNPKNIVKCQIGTNRQLICNGFYPGINVGTAYLPYAYSVPSGASNEVATLQCSIEAGTFKLSCDPITASTGRVLTTFYTDSTKHWYFDAAGQTRSSYSTDYSSLTLVAVPAPP